MQLPNQLNFATPVGSRWVQTFMFKNPDGTLMDLTGLTWEFVIRPTVVDATSPALVQVTTTSSAQGQISVDLPSATLSVTLTPAATTILGQGSRPHALWSNPGLSTAVCWVTGTFTSQPVAEP